MPGTKRSVRFLFLLTVTLATIAAACGDADGESRTDAGAATTTSSASDPSAPGNSLPSGDQGEGSDAAGGTRPAGGTDAFAVADLTVVVEAPDGTVQEYRLSCLGDTATLDGDAAVDASAACRALLDPSVVERLVNGPPADLMCTEIFGSAHTASVTGTLASADVDAEFHRADGCGIDDWDSLMASILPEATE